MEFIKIYPRKDSEDWQHPSAVWSPRDHPEIQIYKARKAPEKNHQWIVVLDGGLQKTTPGWIRQLCRDAPRQWAGEPCLRLFPDKQLASLEEAKQALITSQQVEAGGHLSERLSGQG